MDMARALVASVAFVSGVERNAQVRRVELSRVVRNLRGVSYVRVGHSVPVRDTARTIEDTSSFQSGHSVTGAGTAVEGRAVRPARQWRGAGG